MKPNPVKVMQIVHAAFCLSIFLFTLVTSLTNQQQPYFKFLPDGDDPLYPLFPIIGLGLITLSAFLFRKLIGKAVGLTNAEQKVSAYQTAFIAKCACLEAACMIQITAYFLNPNMMFLLIAVLGLAFLITARPAKEKVIDTLSLVYPDTEKL